MAALSRKDSEGRQAAVLRFFVENPRATGDEAQKALTTGRLTGQKGPPMGNGMLYKLQRQAQDLAAKGTKPPPMAVAFKGDSASLDDEALQAIRARGHELQQLLLDAPPNTILEIHISKDGVRVRRMKETEESL